jgi:hypothetical protein
MSKPEVEVLGRATDEEALRLTVAFYCIMEPSGRAQVLALAEELARRSPRVEGVTHFCDLTDTSRKS